MIVTVPFTLICHLLLIFFIIAHTVSCHHCSYDSDATETADDFEPDYYQDLPDSFGRVIVSEQPLSRVVGVPHSQSCDDYYYVEEPDVRRPPPSKKALKHVRDVEYPSYYERGHVSPRRPPPYRAPIQVFDDSDMC